MLVGPICARMLHQRQIHPVLQQRFGRLFISAGVRPVVGIAPPQLADMHRGHPVKRDPYDDLAGALRWHHRGQFPDRIFGTGKSPHVRSVHARER
jgi:hypothetical protein